LSKAEFGKRHDLAMSKFDYWRRTVQIEDAENMADGHFVEVHVDDNRAEPVRQSTMEVELLCGVKLRFYGVGQAGLYSTGEARTPADLDSLRDSVDRLKRSLEYREFGQIDIPILRQTARTRVS